MPNQHAILSASGASRWMKCTPSARLEEKLPETTSIYAEEGHQAHTLAEQLLRVWLAGEKNADAIKQESGLAGDLIDAVETYVDLCIEKINEARTETADAEIMLEQRLDFRQFVPEGYGTGDLVIVGDKTLEVIDLKTGKGVPVSATDNAQMRLYGLGAVITYAWLYSFNRVRVTIVQPRIDSITSEEMTVAELLDWGNTVVKPLAEKAWLGQGEFVPGDHCRFCKVKATCRARADEALEVTRHEFKDPALLSDDEIGAILAIADRIQSWADDLQKYAMIQALEHGKEWPGWKIVEGRRVRKYIDADKVADVLLAKGYPEAILYERSLLGITAMEKAIGKKPFNELLADLVAVMPGKPVLVPEADKRPPMDRQAETRKSFDETFKFEEE